MQFNNLTSRLRLKSTHAASPRESERQRIKEATKRLRTHAEKIAWHFSELAMPTPQPSPRC